MDNYRNTILERLTHQKAAAERTLEHLRMLQNEYHDLRCGTNPGDESDQAQLETLASRTYSLIERKVNELKRLDRLLDKLHADEDFSFCEECGDPIPFERLLAVPETGLCVSCQRRFEKSSAVRHSGPHLPFALAFQKEREPSQFRSAWDDVEYDLLDFEFDEIPVMTPEDEDIDEP